MSEIYEDDCWEPDFPRSKEDFRALQYEKLFREVTFLNEIGVAVNARVTWFPAGQFYVGFIYRPERPDYPEIATPDHKCLKACIDDTITQLGKEYR